MSGLERLFYLLKRKAQDQYLTPFMYQNAGTYQGDGADPASDGHWRDYLERTMWDDINRYNKMGVNGRMPMNPRPQEQMRSPTPWMMIGPRG